MTKRSLIRVIFCKNDHQIKIIGNNIFLLNTISESCLEDEMMHDQLILNTIYIWIIANSLVCEMPCEFERELRPLDASVPTSHASCVYVVLSFEEKVKLTRQDRSFSLPVLIACLVKAILGPKICNMVRKR